MFFSLLILFCLTCKTPPPPPPPPPPEEMPVSTLIFDRIEAGGIHQIDLYFRLRVENPRSVPLKITIRSWKTAVNGTNLDPKTAVLDADDSAAFHDSIEAAPEDSVDIDLCLHLDLSAFPEKTTVEKRGRPVTVPDEDEYQTELTLDLSYQYGTAKSFRGEASVITAFPRIREPEFTITSIAILQAELINTRFRVSLQIDNPNAFPVTLSSFSYELYGDGLFWADGREKNVLYIPAKGSAETRLFLLMNFINMKRHLLDEIIAMQLVNYRFSGEAVVGIDIPWLPSFNMKFNRSGLSEVFK